jgi:hypothetical protein
MMYFTKQERPSSNIEDHLLDLSACWIAAEMRVYLPECGEIKAGKKRQIRQFALGLGTAEQHGFCTCACPTTVAVPIDCHTQVEHRAKNASGTLADKPLNFGGRRLGGKRPVSDALRLPPPLARES